VFANTKDFEVSVEKQKIAVLGIGNSLLTDDGAGIHALERFADNNSDDDVIFIDGGTVGLALLDRLSNLDGLVVLDAMKLGAKPGTVVTLTGEAMDAHLRNQHGSVHEVGLSDLMDALRLRGDLPAKRALIGIEPEDMGWGTWPTIAVAAALPEACGQARKLVRRWSTEKPMEAVA
jgi:hydrogenase maturation protease